MLNRRQGLKGAIALAGWMACAQPRAATAAVAPPAGPSVVSLIEDHGRHVVEVAINGTGGYRFVLDTGATAHFVSTRAARDLGLKQVEQRAVQGFDGSRRSSVVQIARLVVGGIDTGPTRAIVWEPDQLEGHDGLVGYPFLYPDAVIDLGAGQIRLHGDRPDASTAVQARVMRDETLLVGGFAGAEGRFVFDTGSQSLTISADYYQTVTTTPAYADAAKLVFHNADDEARVVAIRPTELVFGDFRIPQPIVRVGQPDDQRAGVFRGVDALFGVSVIRPFAWAMDQARATLTAAGASPRAVGWYGSGLRLEPDGRALRVAALMRGGPAHEAGVRPGLRVADFTPAPTDRPGLQTLQIVEAGRRRTLAFTTRALI